MHVREYVLRTYACSKCTFVRSVVQRTMRSLPTRYGRSGPGSPSAEVGTAPTQRPKRSGAGAAPALRGRNGPRAQPSAKRPKRPKSWSDLRMHRLRTACGSRDLVLLLGYSARVVDRSVSSDGFRQKRYKLPVGCAIVWDHAAPSANDGESDAKRSKLTADDWHLWQRN